MKDALTELSETCNFFSPKALNNIERKEPDMFALAVSVLLLLFLALASSDLLVSNLSSDELNRMGVERKP
jgi:hypothetical protein